jgi:signal transduction histidine kinase
MSRRATVGRRWRLPPRTVRTRLSALYSFLFLASGAGLLTVTYALVAPRPTVDVAGILTSGQRAQARDAVEQILGSQKAENTVRSLVADQRAATLHQLLLACFIALAVMTVLSAWLGWLVAGRALRPLRVMTAKTRLISDRNLHERLALPGPHDELKELSGTIDGLLARVEAGFTAQRQFVANASHELRTPLTLERAMVEVALADPDASTQLLRATCQRVLAACDQQERIIDALLALARGQRGLDRREPFGLDGIAAEVLAARGEAAERRGLRIETSLGCAPTTGDPQLVERLFTNLIDNAITHNIDGGWITVHTGTSADQAMMLIANSGPPIDAGEISRLLRPFERLGPDRTGQRTGLGLAIVQAIAEAHAARLAIRPPAGGGLEVELRFPAVASSAARAITASAPARRSR